MLNVEDKSFSSIKLQTLINYPTYLKTKINQRILSEFMPVPVFEARARDCRILWHGRFANAYEPVLHNALDFAAVVIELMPTAQIDTKNGCNQCRGR